MGLNGRPHNLEEILEKRGLDIYEVYISAPSYICSSGRRGPRPIGPRNLSRQAELIHKHGVKLNVVMNGSCQGGREFSSQFKRTITDFALLMEEAGVDSVTVANPFMIDLIKSKAKSIAIIISSFAEVIEPVKIERFRSRGADRVVLHQNVYRNFEALRRIRESTDLELEVIPNQGCLNQCECFISHINIVSHSSIAGEEEIASFGDFNFPIKRCRRIRQTDPIEFLMSCFIRPEDLHIYEELGIDIFKFAGRKSSTDWMLNVFDAYINRNYEGNLFDLSSHVGEHPKLCNLPNKALEEWFDYIGSNSDHNLFRRRAQEYCERAKIRKYFPPK